MRIAVIGMGSIGFRHARNLKTLGYSHVQGWDTDPAKGSPIDWSWKPEVVLVCTPPNDHVWTAGRALVEGVKGLFVEKPLSDNWGGKEQALLQEAQDRDAVTMVGANWRFRSGVEDLLFRPGHFAATAIIPIPIERRVTPLWDIGIHLWDLVRWSKHEDGYTLGFLYGEPYDVTIVCGGKKRTWRKGSNAMYLAELRHFLRCVKAGEPTGNDFAFAAETLRLALEVGDA